MKNEELWCIIQKEGLVKKMNNSIVKTKNGQVEGFLEDEVYKWFGIPYAKKPTGELRFRNAQPVENWEGIIKANKMPNKPLQPVFFVQNENVHKSEDCLYLNIWSKDTKKKKPVVVWIYGGAFIMGESSLNMYDGTAFAQDDVVFVSFNYRVGILGGLDLSIYSNDKIIFDSNNIISDQVQALKWIHDNIEAFGGDPDNVTIMGESAGGSSVIFLMTVPEAKGLFHKVICESGIPNCAVHREDTKPALDMMLEHLNLSADNIEEINQKKPEELEEAVLWLLTNLTYKYPGMYLLGPTIGNFITESPINAIKNGCAKDIKLLIGTNLDEATMFSAKENTCMCYDSEQIELMFKQNKISEAKRKEILECYPKYPKREAILAINRDTNFTVHSSLVADYQSKYADAYMYRFDYSNILVKLLGLRAFHSSEIPFAFQTFDKYEWKKFYMLTPKSVTTYFQNVFHTAWVNFIKTGDPNDKNNRVWPKYNEKKEVYVINKKCHLECDPYRELKKVWTDFPFHNIL